MRAQCASNCSHRGDGAAVGPPEWRRRRRGAGGRRRPPCASRGARRSGRYWAHDGARRTSVRAPFFVRDLPRAILAWSRAVIVQTYFPRAGRVWLRLRLQDSDPASRLDPPSRADDALAQFAASSTSASSPPRAPKRGVPGTRPSGSGHRGWASRCRRGRGHHREVPVLGVAGRGRLGHRLFAEPNDLIIAQCERGGPVVICGSRRSASPRLPRPRFSNDALVTSRTRMPTVSRRSSPQSGLDSHGLRDQRSLGDALRRGGESPSPQWRGSCDRLPQQRAQLGSPYPTARALISGPTPTAVVFARGLLGMMAYSSPPPGAGAPDRAYMWGWRIPPRVRWLAAILAALAHMAGKLVHFFLGTGILHRLNLAHRAELNETGAKRWEASRLRGPPPLGPLRHHFRLRPVSLRRSPRSFLAASVGMRWWTFAIAGTLGRWARSGRSWRARPASAGPVRI
jgi:hypothetical protein